MTNQRTQLKDHYTFTQVAVEDMNKVKGLLTEAALWLKDQEINQWDYLLTGKEDEEIEDAILKGETYLVFKGDQPVATFNLNMNPSEWDRLVWGNVSLDAIYLHRLTVRRVDAGQNIGAAIFEWVLEHMKSTGKTYLRLDCVGHNGKLNHFYKKQGFEYLGSSPNAHSKYQMKLI